MVGETAGWDLITVTSDAVQGIQLAGTPEEGPYAASLKHDDIDDECDFLAPPRIAAANRRQSGRPKKKTQTFTDELRAELEAALGADAADALEDEFILTSGIYSGDAEGAAPHGTSDAEDDAQDEDGDDDDEEGSDGDGTEEGSDDGGSTADPLATLADLGLREDRWMYWRLGSDRYLGKIGQVISNTGQISLKAQCGLAAHAKEGGDCCCCFFIMTTEE